MSENESEQMTKYEGNQMSKICPQCGYERKNSDDKFISTEECPKCGIFYKKWTPSSSISNNTETTLTASEASNTNKEQKSIRYNSIIAFAIIFILLAIFVKFTFFLRNESSRLVSKLPVSPFKTAGTSWIIRASGNEETITAAGQLFKPPSQTPVLFKLGFLFTQFGNTKRVSDFKLQVILSEWHGDRPGPTALWVSEPLTISSTNNDYQADWLDFDVPHLFLNPAKLYIAWITLSGLENQYDACVGISYSTERGDNSAYPQGMSAFYKQANPDGDVSQMTDSAWEVHDVGNNLNFRMSFENSINEQDKKNLDNDDAQSRLNEVIQQKTQDAIVQRREREQQKRNENEQQRIERKEQRKQEWEKSEQQRIEREEQRKQERDNSEQQRIAQEEQQKRQQIEREIQQYEIEKKREEIKQQQEEIMRQQQRDRIYIEPRRVQRIYRRR